MFFVLILSKKKGFGPSGATVVDGEGAGCGHRREKPWEGRILSHRASSAGAVAPALLCTVVLAHLALKILEMFIV